MITHGKQAGLAEDVVDERVLWLGRPPSKSGDLKSIGMFADQLEERVTEKLQALPVLRKIETKLLACRMEIANNKNLDHEFENIPPFSESWWNSWTQHDGVSVTAFWLEHSRAYLPFLQNVHRFKRLLQNHTQVLLSEVVSHRPLHYSEVLSKVKCIMATTDAFLKWKAGLTKNMIGRTVEKVAARSEGVLLDEVEALDVMQAVAALNERFTFALAIGAAHGAASQNDVENDVQLVNEEEEEPQEEEEEKWQVNKAYKPQERGVTDFLKKGNGNIENLSGLTLCKRCGPAITSFLSDLLAPMRPQLVDFKSSDKAPATKLDHIMYCGSGWLTWEQLRDDSPLARRGRGLWERPSLDTSSGNKPQVAWHDVLFRALLVHVDWDLKQKGERVLIICFLRRVSEPVAALLAAFLSEEDAKRVDVVLLDSARGLTADRVHVIFSSSFVGCYDQLQGIQADPNRVYVAYARGRLATTVWMEQEPLGLPSDGEERWRRWMPEFENHPAKKSLSPTTQQWFEFAAQRYALLSRGEVEPATTGSAHSAPSHSDCQWYRSSSRQTFTWRALVGTTRALRHCQGSVVRMGLAIYIFRQKSLLHKVDQACEEAKKKVLSTSPEAAGRSSAKSLASIVDQVIDSDVLRAPMMEVRDVGINGMWLEHTAEIHSESLSNSSQEREEGLNFEILRHKAELKEDEEGDAWFQKSCRSDRFAVAYTDPQKPKKGHKRLYLYRGGGCLDALATPLMGGLVVRSETQVFAAIVLVTLHFLSGCSPASEELVGFVKECLVVEEDLYVDPETTDDVEDAELFAQKFTETRDRHCRKFQALYEGILADVRDCLESRAGREWPAATTVTLVRHAPGRPFCMPRLGTTNRKERRISPSQRLIFQP